jgi:crotonobetaine/carnitine-CoA ligase
MATFLVKQSPAEHDRGHRLHSVVMAPTIPDVQAFAERFGVRVITSYGSTEAGSVTASLARGDDCGVLHPEFEGRIVDEHDREVPRGEVGELLLRAHRPWVLTSGYLGRPAASLELWRNGWLHTGDGFRLGDDGRLQFVGRQKDTIRRRGENISAAEVERAALAHPRIVECAAIGVPSADMEEEVKLVATVSGELDEQEVVLFLAERLPYFMVPRYVAFVARLPLTATNKVDKRALAQQDAATWDREAAGLRVTRDGVSWRDGAGART